MVPKTPLATRCPGSQPSAERIVGAPKHDCIALSGQQIEVTATNKALKDVLTQCIKEARIIRAARVIGEAEVNKVCQLAKPAKADRLQLRGGLLLSSKHLGKLYHKHMKLDKKKAAAVAKHKETKALAERKVLSKTNKRKLIYLDDAKEVNTSSYNDEESESSSDD
ncbi:hypothetical protein HOY80DRAFT_1037257 [Tuber brumale]|nr:hypothetical protein HOY80DRAFT_1037257 [Tuber brumale]